MEAVAIRRMAGAEHYADRDKMWVRRQHARDRLCSTPVAVLVYGEALLSVGREGDLLNLVGLNGLKEGRVGPGGAPRLGRDSRLSERGGRSSERANLRAPASTHLERRRVGAARYGMPGREERSGLEGRGDGQRGCEQHREGGSHG
eukprot:scaffold283768_cov30-Tisochrysis_lutea.AAC.1